MTLAFWLRSSLTTLVSFSPAILAAGPVDPPTWEAVDKTLGRPGRVLPGVNPVVRALQAGGLDVLAIHNHLIGEAPQVIYVHFGGHAEAQKVASALRAALDATKTPLAAPGPAPSRVPPRPRRSTRSRQS